MLPIVSLKVVWFLVLILILDLSELCVLQGLSN